MKNSLLVPGSLITKATAAGYITRMYKRFAIDRGLTMEASIMLDNIEREIVKAGFLTWQQVEAAETAAFD